MLKSLELRNFRGFKEHRVEFSSFSLLIGQNNAGKTTIIEALRIISLAQVKASSANFVMAPESIDSEVTGPVFRVSLSAIGFEYESVHHRYESDSPAVIIAKLTNNCSVTVVIGDDPAAVFCQLAEPGSKKVNNRNLSSNPKFGQILVMPPIGHLLVHEPPISDDYLRKNTVGYRAHRHLRNHMQKNPLEFLTFKSVIEDSWTSLQFGNMSLVTREEGSEYQVSVRDGPFVSEIGMQGSGLQAWAQIVWFLARSPKSSIIVLDEPDVYLHADLQRKLLKILGSLHFQQNIIATHSIEMISDVQCGEIILIKKRDRVSRPLSSMDEMQSAIESIGTVHNLQLSKLANSGSVLFLEGKDKSFLSEIAYKMGPRIFDRLSAIPSFPVGGFNNWPRAALTAKAFHENSSGRVKSYIILDRDYKAHQEVNSIIERAKNDNLSVICWNKKEIENYLIKAGAIARVIENSVGYAVPVNEIQSIIDEICEEMIGELEGQVAESIRCTGNYILDVTNEVAHKHCNSLRRLRCLILPTRFSAMRTRRANILKPSIGRTVPSAPSAARRSVLSA
jgi:ABC-type multidrug transport system ATPase subunit